MQSRSRSQKNKKSAGKIHKFVSDDLPKNIITIVEDNDSYSTALIKNNDVKFVNLLRRSIMSEIPTYAIEIVVFYINTSPREDEIIALRLGQVPIDHNKSNLPKNGEDLIIEFNYTAPNTQNSTIVFNTDDIESFNNDIKFVDKTPICEMKAGQSIKCKCIVRIGVAKTHVKYRPVSNVYYDKDPNTDNYLLTIKSIGMLTHKQIFSEGIKHMKDAASSEPKTIFNIPLLPEEFKP